MTSNTNTTKRTIGREYAFKFIYKHLLNDFSTEKSEIINDSKALNDALNLFDDSYHEEDSEHPDNKIDIHTKMFAKELILGSLRQEPTNSKLIEKYLTNNNLQKVDRMNLAVLLLGSYEILSDKDTPAGVFINEYVNIAKKYCPNDSHGFINSVLDKIAKDHR
ncbi:NusB antitermination factor [Bacteriovorax stolpii]|uniref:transcription antitermination factor NusB n=1 Tax=Bacteriovorax stolpii TaxID=960 RepID=UPI0010E03DAA|nr:transcription antitermination factor NusB [Bacteriovorax stolpii]TDP55110.1 NusB antitermination factor [Bacteriovorax stolpii]